MDETATGLDLPITTTFPCRASPRARATRHEVQIAEDWTVCTPHDEDLERIAAAFGGGVSCMPALRAVMPGFRMWWERATRQPGLLSRSPDWGATWICIDSAPACCPARGFADAAAAAEHCRTVAHVAAASTTSVRDLRALVRGLGQAADPAPPTGSGDPLVEGAWACGLQPRVVHELRYQLAAAGAPEPDLGLVLALTHTGADPTWVAASAGSGDAPTAEWAAWTGTELDRRKPDARRRWLTTGARRVDIVTLSMAGYQASTAQEVARTWGISVPGAAQLLGRWVRSGYVPTPDQLAWVGLEGLGFPPEPPASSAVERVSRALGTRRPDRAHRTHLAVAMARWGTVPDTVARLRRAGESDRPPPLAAAPLM